MIQKAMFRQEQEREWFPTVLVEVAAATAGSILMLAALAVVAWGLAGLLG